MPFVLFNFSLRRRVAARDFTTEAESAEAVGTRITEFNELKTANSKLKT
jgi:hypothetical protein